MMKVMKIAGISFLIVIVLLVVVFGFYWYQNIHWYDKYEKALKKAGAQEKQVTLESGNVINYGEVTNDKPALPMERLPQRTLPHTGDKILLALFWKIRRYSLQKEKAGKTALRIWMHINRSMITMPPTNLSVGKHIISDIAIGDNCL